MQILIYLKSVMAYTCLTERLTNQSEMKVGHSDLVSLCGKIITQRIKGTPGITGLWFLRVLIDEIVWHLDVGSSHPGVENDSKGSAVRRLKWYVSWV
jgi:hypothetical protein